MAPVHQTGSLWVRTLQLQRTLGQVLLWRGSRRTGKTTRKRRSITLRGGKSLLKPHRLFCVCVLGPIHGHSWSIWGRRRLPGMPTFHGGNQLPHLHRRILQAGGSSRQRHGALHSWVGYMFFCFLFFSHELFNWRAGLPGDWPFSSFQLANATVIIATLAAAHPRPVNANAKRLSEGPRIAQFVPMDTTTIRTANHVTVLPMALCKLTHVFYLSISYPKLSFNLVCSLL